MSLENIKVGDKVMVESYVSGQRIWSREVTNLTYKHDRGSGEPYPVIVLENGDEFDATTGNAVSPQTSYCIKQIVR
jgi:hypothetical protein